MRFPVGQQVHYPGWHRRLVLVCAIPSENWQDSPRSATVPPAGSNTSSGRPAPEIRLSERPGHHYPRVHHCQFGPIGMARLRQADHATGRLDGATEAIVEDCRLGILCALPDSLVLLLAPFLEYFVASEGGEKVHATINALDLCGDFGRERRRIRRWRAGRRAHRGLAHQFRSRKFPAPWPPFRRPPTRNPRSGWSAARVVRTVWRRDSRRIFRLQPRFRSCAWSPDGSGLRV